MSTWPRLWRLISVTIITMWASFFSLSSVKMFRALSSSSHCLLKLQLCYLPAVKGDQLHCVWSQSSFSTISTKALIGWSPVGARRVSDPPSDPRGVGPAAPPAEGKHNSPTWVCTIGSFLTPCGWQELQKGLNKLSGRLMPCLTTDGDNGAAEAAKVEDLMLLVDAMLEDTAADDEKVELCLIL